MKTIEPRLKFSLSWLPENLIKNFLREIIGRNSDSHYKVPARNFLMSLVLKVGVFLNGCSSREEPVSEAVMHLTFDGERCIFEGPIYLKAGPATLYFHNDSDQIAAVNLLRHTGSETSQDVIGYLGEEPSSKIASPWTIKDDTWQAILPGDEHTWMGDLEPGNHHMVCARISPLGVWFGTGLEVVQ